MEEIGLDPALPEVLGALPRVHTTVSGILVVPFVGMLETLPSLPPSDGEFDEVLAFPVRRLLEAEALVEWERADGRRWKGWTYEIDGSDDLGRHRSDAHELLDDRSQGERVSQPEPYGPSDAELRSILGDARTIAVVGLSVEPVPRLVRGRRVPAGRRGTGSSP